MYEVIQQGGSIIYVLLACSVLALTVIFERAWSLRRASVIPDTVVKDIEAAIRNNDADLAIDICRKDRSSMGRIIWVALRYRGVRRSVMKEMLEEAGRQEVAELERYVGVLGVIAAIAPLLGLLGTVLGMIEVFQVISIEGVGKADVLAGGISKALITTAAGLIVAIPTLVAHRYYESRIDRMVVDIEHHAIRFVELLKGER